MSSLGEGETVIAGNQGVCVIKGGSDRLEGKKEFHFLFFRGSDGIGGSTERLGRREKTAEMGRGQAECAREVNARIICQKQNKSDPVEKKYITEGRLA